MNPKCTRKAPKHLSAASREWWLSVVREYELEEHHVLLLTAAAEALDRITEAREAIAQDGAYFTDRHGSRKPHPGLAVERDNRMLFARLLRELALDVETPPEAARPPHLAGYESR